MSKNAIANLDMWKTQAEEVMKTKQSLIASSIIVYLQEQGPKSPKEVHNFLVKNKPSEYEDVLESNLQKLPEWASQRDGINYDTASKKLSADADKLIKEPLTKAYKTPEEYRTGVFKLYMRKDDNLVILDVSDKETVEDRGFVPGAVNISLGTLYYKADSEVPDDYKDDRIQDRDKKVVMTCSIGACAAIGGKLLKDMGFKDVVLLEGGVEAWKKSGYDIEK